MPTFMVTMNFTEQGVKTIKDAPKRTQAARELAKKFGATITAVYLTAGDTDLVGFIDAPSGEDVAKFVLTLGASGNVRTKMVRAWTEPEYFKLVSELP